jgi:hypothetical protein
MDDQGISRKEFLVLTFTLIGGGAFVAACSSSTSNPTDGGGGHAGGGAGGRGGAGGGAGAGGSAGTGGAGGSGTAACADPLPETQEPDATGHVHTVIVPAAMLDSTTDQMFTTSSAGSPAHTHMITLTAADLAMLKSGGSVTGVMSTTVLSHFHAYDLSCQ